MKNMTSELQQLNTVKKIKKAISHLEKAGAEFREIWKDKSRGQEIRKRFNAVKKDLRKQVDVDVERVRKFVNQAREELESFKKDYLNPKKKVRQTIAKLSKMTKPVSRKRGPRVKPTVEKVLQTNAKSRNEEAVTGVNAD